MNPPFFSTVAGDAAVKAVLGSPPRVYPWGENSDKEVVYPYVTFQLVPGGSPLHLLAGRPGADEGTLQVDVWAKTAKEARAALAAVRDAIELKCHITSWRGESRDPETGSYRTGFDCRWIVLR